MNSKELKTLCKCLTVTKKQAVIWDELCSKCDKSLSSLVNIRQQIACCGRVTLRSPPIFDRFPDLERRLHVKLLEQGDAAMRDLRRHVSVMVACHQRIWRASNDATRGLKSLERDERAYAWTATSPSACDVARCLRAFATCVSDQLFDKQTLLTEIALVDCDVVERGDIMTRMKKSWDSHEPLSLMLNQLSDLCLYLESNVAS